VNLTDRNLIIGLMELVGSLAKRITGATPILRVRDDEGNFVDVGTALGEVRWLEKKPDKSTWQPPVLGGPRPASWVQELAIEDEIRRIVREEMEARAREQAQKQEARHS
jgi:hypothetical protein